MAQPLRRITSVRPFNQGLAAWLTSLVFVGLFVGCYSDKPIGHYRVPHEESSAPFHFDRPQGWSPSIPNEFSVLAFTVRDGDRRASMTVSSLDAAGSGLLPNINRWRRQLELPPISGEEMNASLTTVPVGADEGKLVELAGAGEKQGQGTLGIIALHGGRGWFFKLSGDNDLLEREKAHFLQFAASVKFRPAEGASHGHP